MMVDFDMVIRDFRGTPVRTQAGEAMTIGDACLQVLQLDQSTETSGEIKTQQFRLGLRIGLAREPINLSPEEVVLLKTAAGKWNPLIRGRVFEAIDPEGMKTA